MPIRNCSSSYKRLIMLLIFVIGRPCSAFIREISENSCFKAFSAFSANSIRGLLRSIHLISIFRSKNKFKFYIRSKSKSSSSFSFSSYKALKPLKAGDETMRILAAAIGFCSIRRYLFIFDYKKITKKSI